ncbi:MAG: Plug domain-containing protein [Sphingomonadales bacterium]|nr:Plug domain-containing protein [Sphingomonadales bacterium]
MSRTPKQELPHRLLKESGVQDIVVTARKRAENVQDIPVSIRAVDAEMIQRQDISGLEKLAAKAPELIIARSSNGSGASLTIRGVGSNFSSVGVEQSVAVIVDGAYYGHGRTIDEGFFRSGPRRGPEGAPGTLLRQECDCRCDINYDCRSWRCV